MILTRRTALLALLLIVLVALIATWWAFLAGVGVLTAVIVLDWLLAGNPRQVTLRRGGDTSVRLGEQAATTLLIGNAGTRRLRCVVRDSWIPSAGASGGVTRHVIAPRQRRRTTTVLHPTRRGDRQAGPVVVRSLGPLGIAGRQRLHTVPWAVRVLPPFTSRRHLPSRVARLRELDGRSTILQRGQGTEFDSLREYVPGDDVRAIDWRGTARSSTVVVKTWRPERDRHVLIVIDSGRTSAGRVGDQTRLDHDFDAALLLAALASRAGDRVDLLIADRLVRASVQRSSQADLLTDLVNAMAPIEPAMTESHYRTLVTEALARVSQRSLVVIITGLETAVISEGLIPVLGPLLRRHKIVIASVSDPAVDTLAHGHEAPSEVYAAAAAEADRGRREQTVRVLQRLGASVVQAPPERFAPELADHYLALKKAGQL